jgi:hypothetical protein
LNVSVIGIRVRIARLVGVGVVALGKMHLQRAMDGTAGPAALVSRIDTASALAAQLRSKRRGETEPFAAIASAGSPEARSRQPYSLHFPERNQTDRGHRGRIDVPLTGGKS